MWDDLQLASWCRDCDGDDFKSWPCQTLPWCWWWCSCWWLWGLLKVQEDSGDGDPWLEAFPFPTLAPEYQHLQSTTKAAQVASSSSSCLHLCTEYDLWQEFFPPQNCSGTSPNTSLASRWKLHFSGGELYYFNLLCNNAHSVNKF